MQPQYVECTIRGIGCECPGGKRQFQELVDYLSQTHTNYKMNLVYFYTNDLWFVVGLSSLRQVLVDVPISEMMLRTKDQITAQLLQPDIYGNFKTFINHLPKVPNDTVEIFEDESAHKKRIIAFTKQKGWKTTVGKFLVKRVETF